MCSIGSNLLCCYTPFELDSSPLQAKPGQAMGALWWIERELTEAKVRIAHLFLLDRFVLY